MDDIERTDAADRAEPTGLAETTELTELVPGETSLRIPVDDAVLDADLGVPEAARPGFGRTGTGLVVFAHGSGSSRLSPRNRYVARALREAGLATLARFRELRAGAPDELTAAQARELIRELKAVGGDLRALRLALTGNERGPELWAVLVGLSREAALRRAAPRPAARA